MSDRYTRKPAAVDHEVRQVLDALIGIIRGGQTPDQAASTLRAVARDPEIVDRAVDEYWREANEIRLLQPAVEASEGPGLWYPGPRPGDRCWPALKRHLEGKGWGADAVRSVSDSSSRIVSLLAPPWSGVISTRGLVVGYIQSGKTANYTSVIAKAADAGYKFFLVLSGVHNALRSQTQARLQTELVDLNRELWVALTSEESDFHLGGALHADAFLTEHAHQKVLCVVKKNATVLRRLLRWLRAAQKSVLAGCSVLVIDDEADQASINAAGMEDYRTKINQLVINVLSELPKAALVGYTATPFANVFIDPSVPEDLYPKDFIVSLPRPPDYFGPERIFGRERLSQEDEGIEFTGTDVVRLVPDDERDSLQPGGTRDQASFMPALTPSLECALRYFWLATAARAARGHHTEHSSMLIHTTLYAATHDRFRPLVESYRDSLIASIQQNGQAKEILREQWNNETGRVRAADVGEPETSFDDLWPYMPECLRRTTVVVENSRNVERLDYSGDPQIVVVVGGNVLSRGLTLEGLVVSFFVRTSSAYDTLLQMGRWFGFRKGYSDLPRMWMTMELQGYFFDLATVEQEIRYDIARYQLEQITPLDFGVRIRTHPKLSITSKLKMGAAIDQDVSYSDRRLQTIIFKHRDRDWLASNLAAAGSLVAEAVEGGARIHRRDRRIVIRGVAADHILRFLEAYRFHEDSQELNSGLLRDYIQAQNRNDELKSWNIVIVGKRVSAGTDTIPLTAGVEVPLLTRTRLRAGASTDRANIGALMSDADRVDDLDIGREQIRDKKPGELQAMRPPGIGLLLIYAIDPNSKPKDEESGLRIPLEAVETVIGLGLVFPKAKNESPRRYRTVDLSRVEREALEMPEEVEVDEEEETA